MFRLSIVIPCPKDTSHFEATLASVLQNRPMDAEILVVQPWAYDDPYDLADEVHFIEAAADSTYVDLINRGIKQATASIVHVLACGTEVSETWTDAALRNFDAPTIGSVAPTLISGPHANEIPTAGLAYGVGGCRKLRRCRTWLRFFQAPVLGPTLTAGFYRRSAVLEAGGFCVSVGKRFADVDMGLALEQQGYRSAHEARSIVRFLEPAGQDRLSFGAGREAERLYWRHAPLVGWPRSLVWHAGTVAAELGRNCYRPQMCLQLLGRIVAGIESLAGKGGDRQRTTPIHCPDKQRDDVARPTSVSLSTRSNDATDRRWDAA